MGSPELPAPESEGSSSTTAEASTGALRGLLLRVAALKARGAGLSWIRPDGIRQARFGLRQHVRIYGIKSAAKKLAPPFVSNMMVGSVLFGTQSVISNALTKSTLGHTESGTPTKTIATETLAGSMAGFVHACVAAPLQSVTHGARNWSRKVLFAELPILLGRDIVGFGLFFCCWHFGAPASGGVDYCRHVIPQLEGWHELTATVLAGCTAGGIYNIVAHPCNRGLDILRRASKKSRVSKHECVHYSWKSVSEALKHAGWKKATKGLGKSTATAAAAAGAAFVFLEAIIECAQLSLE
jgi:hypothetical protein